MILPKYLKAESHALSITLIGCGGTGSILLQHLARINKSMIALGSKGLALTCIDSDIVTEANLGRQLFSQVDIGRPKSVVMVERINRFYGTNWFALACRFNKDIMRRNEFPGNIIISCVDDIKTRRFIANYVSNNSMKKLRDNINTFFWIDTGNGKNYGQVILSTPKQNLPNVFTMYPGLKDSKKDKMPSCSLAEALSSQDLFINSDIALTAAKLVWDITQKDELNWRGAIINQDKQTPIRKINI